MMTTIHGFELLREEQIDEINNYGPTFRGFLIGFFVGTTVGICEDFLFLVRFRNKTYLFLLLFRKLVYSIVWLFVMLLYSMDTSRLDYWHVAINKGWFDWLDGFFASFL